MKLQSNPHLVFFLRIWIGLIFAFAGYSKLMEPVENFRGMLAEYQVLPYGSLSIVASIVPWLEFISGVFMILGFAIPLAAAAMIFLNLGFLIVVGSSSLILNAANSTCGCFGQNSPIHLTLWQVFLLDFIDLIIAGKLFLGKKTIWSLDNLLEKK